MNGFEATFFRNNRRKLRQVFGGTAPIVVTANGLIQKTRQDDVYEFHQDANFWYLSGIDEPNFTLVIDKDKDYIIGPQVDEHWRIFHGDIDLESPQAKSGVDEALPGRQGWQKLAKRLKKSRHVATIVPPKPFDETYQVYTNPAKRRLISLLKSYNRDLKLVDISKHLANLRTIKQPSEIEAIQSTIDDTIAAYRIISRKIGKYTNEREVSAEIDYIFAKKGLKLSFRQIVAGGKNAVTLHYGKNNATLNKGEILLIDMGASKNHYCSDLTRAVTPRPTKRQLDVYSAVLQVHEFALKMLRPGVQLVAYEAAINYYMGEKLRELGLVKTISDEAVNRYYPHNTSHFLGIDVHDVGDFSRPLAANTVLTVEPGIYIPEENIGIRVEDDVLLSEDGNRVLSARLSRELASLTILSK